MLEPSHRRHARRRRRGPLILGALVLLTVLAAGGAGGLYVYATGASGERTPLKVEIPQGSTTAEIAALLHDRGVIRSTLGFRLKARLDGIGEDLEAGLYELSTNMSVDEVLAVLLRGPAPPPSVTFGVPEGLRVEAVARRAAKALGFKEQAFLDLARGGTLSLPPYLPEGAGTVEGFLFPKTYEFALNPKPKAVIQRMLDQFAAEVDGLPWDRAEDFGLSHYEVVVVASLIEREARVDEDRGKIARVIYNRLEIGQALEIDATIQYALGENRPITNDDKAIDSPYNTYQHTGLTPTPIANPGLKSIEAALSPTPGEWLYYLTVDDSGRHEFFETYAEFLAALNSRS